jgi:hypothetical protein
MSCHPFSDESDEDICPKCGQWFAAHNDDGSCVTDADITEPPVRDTVEPEEAIMDESRCFVCGAFLRIEEVSLCCDCNEALCHPLSIRESY